MKKKSFILGLDASVDSSYALNSRRLYDRVGHNVGNLVFHYAIKKYIGGIIRSVPWSGSAHLINKFGEIAVIPCANHLGPHADFGGLATIFESYDTKMVAIGLGAQTHQAVIPPVPEGTQRWIKAIVERAPTPSKPNISVRGEFTHRVMESIGYAEQSVVLGCPSLFINPAPKLGQSIARKTKFPPRKIAVAAGHPGWKWLQKIEVSLSDMVSMTNGAYIVQSPLEMVQLSRGEYREIEPDLFDQYREYIKPNLNKEEFVDWCSQYAHAFFDVSAWMEYLRNFDFVIGPRIHGVMLGLQAGIPSLCIAHDSRTIELCETMLVPYVNAEKIREGFSIKDLPDLFKFDSVKFDENRQMLKERYDDFLRSNALIT